MDEKNKLKKSLKPLFKKIYLKGGRGITVFPNSIKGYVAEPDLARYPKKKITKTISYKHSFKTGLKHGEVYRMGGSHFYKEKKANKPVRVSRHKRKTGSIVRNHSRRKPRRGRR